MITLMPGSVRTMLAEAFATLEAPFTAMPTSACFKAAASLTPSPGHPRGVPVRLQKLHDPVLVLRIDFRQPAASLDNVHLFVLAFAARSPMRIQAAASLIRDTDMATKMVEFVKDQILVQSSTAMLAQANTKPQSVRQLFR